MALMFIFLANITMAKRIELNFWFSSGFNAKECIMEMVDEYNSNISKITGHKIKGWFMQGIERNKWVGWGPENDYTVDLSKFLKEIK